MGKAKTLLTCALVCAASLTSAADEFEITVFNGYAEYENCALMKINIDQTTNQGELSKLMYTDTNPFKLVVPEQISMSLNGQVTITPKKISDLFFRTATNTLEQKYQQGASYVIEADLGNSIEEIGDYCFYQFKNLKNIVLPPNLKRIGNSAFEFCTSLTSVVFPEGLESVGDNAFYKCNSIEEFVFPNSLTTYGVLSFAGCANLKRIYLPETVTSINNSFNSCKSLTDVFISATTPPTLINETEDAASFPPNVKFTIHIPEGAYNTYYEKWHGLRYMDNATIVADIKSGVNSIRANGLTAKVDGDALLVESTAEGIDVFSISGVLVASTTECSLNARLPKGIYIVRSANSSKKVVL